MLTRSKLKLEGELVETNPEIGRVYSRKTMSEEGSIGPDSQFIEIFLAIKPMVEKMYRDFRKHKGEGSSGSKQDKEEDFAWQGGSWIPQATRSTQTLVLPTSFVTLGL